MDNEIIDDMPAAEYHAADAVGSTTLREFDAKSLRHAETPFGGSSAARLGTLAHTAILEPDVWEVEYLAARKPHDLYHKHDKCAALAAGGAHFEGIADELGVKPSTVRGKYFDKREIGEMFVHYLQHDPDKAPDDGDVETVHAMRDSVREYLEAGGHMPFFRACRREVSGFWTDEGIDCKGRFDLLAENDSALIAGDLKTTGRDIGDTHSFTRMVTNRRYHLQAGHYLNGLERLTGKPVERWIWLVVETSEPYGVRLFDLQGDDLATCKRRASDALVAYADAKQSDDYDGYSTEITTIELPEWA